MRKHFLLFFLMALLPLAGWAYDYEVDVEVKPYNASVVWSGVKPGGVEASWIGAPGSSLTPAVKSAIAAQLEINNLADYNAGIHDYYLQLKSTAAGYVDNGETRYNIRLNDANTAKLTIEKYEGDFVFTTTDLAFVDDDLVYTSQPQALLKAGATATANGFTVPVVYATSATAENWVALADLKETNANTTGYTVYYKVVGTDNYAGSEVQTMLGTKAIAKATITFNLSAAAGLTYNGAPQALLALTDNTKPATNFGASTLQYKIDDAEEWAELPEAGIAGITGTSAKNGVAYSINLKVPADENGNWDETVITTPIATTIAKVTPIFTYVPNHENGGLPSGLVYDTHSHQLVLQEATAIVDGTEISVPVKYSIRRYKNVSKGYTVWTEKTYDQLVGNYASSQYQIRVKTDATDDLNQAIQSLENVVIAKATIPADAYTEPVAKNVRTTDALQPLVDAATWTGETTYGTFQYSLTNNGTDWSTDVPQGTEVAEYTVYWRIYPTVTSDTQNYNIVSGNYTSNITDKSKVTVTTAANQSFGYGTTPVIEKTVVWGTQGEDALNEEALVWKWYTNSDCSIPATVDGNGNFTVGDYYVKASGLAVTGATAASQEIVYVPALVQITAGQVTAKITGTATYGSQPEFTLTHVSGLSPAEAASFDAAHNLTKVTIKQNGEVVNNLEDVAPDNVGLAALAKGEYDLEATASCGTNYAVVVTGEKLTVSAKSITGAVIDVTTDADAIVYNNKAWGTVNPIAFTVNETSGIEDADYDVTYSNNVNAGTATITLTGKRNYTGTVTKDFTIKKAGLTIKADDTTWTYGTTEPTYAVTVEGQAEGETALEVGGTLAGIDGALTVVRTSNETVGAHAGALVAQFGTDQPIESDNYAIIYSAGNLQVAKGAVVIQLKEAVTATYGDNPATSINAAITDIANYEHVSGLSELEAANLASFIDVAAATFELTETKPQVGTDYTFAIDGATSTNYDVEINPGKYTVTPLPITITAYDQVIAQGADIAQDEYVAAPAPVAGDDLNIVLTATKSAVGEWDDAITVAATNANYDFTFVPGKLTISPATSIELSRTEGVEQLIKDYDGEDVDVILNRNITRTEAWFAMVLPFEVSVAELSQKFGYAIVNVLDESNTEPSKVKFKINMQTIAANQPFLVKIASPITASVDFGEKKIVYNAEPKSQDAAGNTFYGIFKTTALEASENLWIMVPAQNKFNKLDQSGQSLTPINAYLKTAQNLDSFAPSIFVEEIDGTVTAINGVDAEVEQNAEGWYTINGVKLNAKPTQKGIYIYNGKKVAIQ